MLARRRLTKLVAAVGQIVSAIDKAGDKVPDPTWRKDFKAVHKDLTELERGQRAAKVERVDLAPELAAARERWLAAYGANKLLIRGLLAHAGKPELLPLIFDDLAEVHRTAGVSDEPAPQNGADANEAVAPS